MQTAPDTAWQASTLGGAGHSLGLESLTQEVGPILLAVEGRVPDWLDGALLRTGPALFEIGDSRCRHWFDGLAMLYRFGFRDGRIEYTNRLLRSRAYEAARKQGRIASGEFGTAPDGSLPRIVRLIRGPDSTDNANVNVIARQRGAYALTETPQPVAFEAETLQTIATMPYRDALRGQVTAAHPHDVGDGVLMNYLLEFGRQSRIHVFELPPGDAPRRRIASVTAARPAYMHSFGVTDRHVVLIEPPLRVNPLALRFSTRPFIDNHRWHAGDGIRFRLIDRSDGTETVVEGEPCFVFHQVNAFDDGDAVVIDLCAYPDADIVDAFRLDRMRMPGSAAVAASRLRRYRLPKTGGSAQMEMLSDEAVEFPCIHVRSAGRRHHGLWAAGASNAGSGFFNRLQRIDRDGGRAALWEQTDCFVGEPVFVPHPGGGASDGVVLSVILDAAARRSALLLLDATSLQPIARADLPHITPFQLHGRFVHRVSHAATTAAAAS